MRLLGIGASGLQPAGEAGHQASLFEPRRPRENPVDRTLDAIRERFGRGSVARAATQDADQTPGPLPRLPDDRA